MKIWTGPSLGFVDDALLAAGCTIVADGEDRCLIRTDTLRNLKPHLARIANPESRFIEGEVPREDFIRALAKYEQKHTEWAGKFAHVAGTPFLRPTYGWGWNHARGYVVWDPTSLVLDQWAPEGLGPDGRFIECSMALNHERLQVWLTNDAPADSTWRCVARIGLDRGTYTSVAGIIPSRGFRWRSEVVYAALAGALVMMHPMDQLEMSREFSLSRNIVERWSCERIAEAAREQHEALSAQRWSRDRALEVLSGFIA